MKTTDRKQELVAQAALHRQRMAQASVAIAAGMHPGVLLRGAGSLALSGLALLRNSGGVGPAGLAALLPLVAPLAQRGLSLLGAVKTARPAVRKLLAVGVLGAVAAYAVKKLTTARRGRSGR